MNKISGLGQLPVLLRLLAFLVILALCWLPLGFPILHWVRDPNWQSILGLGLLYGQFLFLVRWWGRAVHHMPQVLNHYGFTFSSGNLRSLGIGMGVSSLCLLGLYGFQGALGWLQWHLPDWAFVRVFWEGLAVALGIGFAEELLFRGWLWDEFQRDYGDRRTLIITTHLYAILHFIKPLPEIIRTLPQFPGLILLGLIFAWAKQIGRGQLGLAIGLHAGFVWAYYWIVVGNLTSLPPSPPGNEDLNQAIPTWVTGIDDNPLAGLLGIILLSGLAWGIRQTLLRSTRPESVL
jgi:membrane protease YdiL (CAAX protease family)